MKNLALLIGDQLNRNMSLQFYNSLSKKIEPFKSLKQDEVSIYVCGITPYDTTHLGHAFTYMSFDALTKFFRFLGYRVNYVQNVTDIDDDILKRARAAGEDWQRLGQFWTDKFLLDLKLLNIKLPTRYVKATDAIPTIIKITSDLLKKGYAYKVRDTVYFDVKKFDGYGKLSGFSKSQMMLISSERGGDPKDPAKNNPLDFVLWKKSEKDEPSWDSPMGPGRPGWHIECTSMIYENLGDQIDIHGGGRDLIFPHHESEIAQSESFTGKKPFVNFWMHTGMVFYKGEKMAKSLGNLVMVSELLKKYTANQIRFCLLKHHYRQLWEFEELEMQDCVDEFETLFAKCKATDNDSKNIDEDFLNALNRDFDTPRALEILLEKKPSSLKSCLILLGFQFD